MLGFATFTQEVRSNIFGQVMKYAVLAAFWLLAALIAFRLHYTVTTRLWRQENGAGADPPPLAWRLGRAFNPIFIAQDAAGSGSLAKLQLLAFTGVVVAIVAQGWYASLHPARLLDHGARAPRHHLGRVGAVPRRLGRRQPPRRTGSAGRPWRARPDPRMPKLTDLFGTQKARSTSLGCRRCASAPMCSLPC